MGGEEDQGLQPWAQGPYDQVPGGFLTPLGLWVGPFPLWTSVSPLCEMEMKMMKTHRRDSQAAPWA